MRRNAWCGPGSGRWAGGLQRIVFSIAGFVIFFPVGTSVDAYQNDGPNEIEAALQAGEFGSAIEMARQLPQGESDRWLGRIAESQFRTGARDAALQTTRGINADDRRARTVAGFYQRRSGRSDSYLYNSNSGNSFRGGSNDWPPLGDQGGLPGGGQGGITINDFQPLIDLIQSTIAPDEWDITNGDGSIHPYPAGVFVDANGQMKRIRKSATTGLAQIRSRAQQGTGSSSLQENSDLRMVSLTRLEREVQLRAAIGLPPTEPMKYLAGLTSVEYLLFFPETNDIVIAGPAGPWRAGADQRVVNAKSGEPVLRLDDLVVCLRNAFYNDGQFGCTITPRKENLADTQQFISTTDLQGKAWREELKARLGNQLVNVFGIDRRTHAGRVIVEADYRMKLVGMGLEPSIPEIPSCLEQVDPEHDKNLPPLVRWWFTMNYDDLVADAAGRSFRLNGSGVKVLAENEFLAANGDRIHTGRDDGPSGEFARNFTQHFDKIGAKYPVYRQLKNVFDLALISAVIRDRGLNSSAEWNLTYFGRETEEGGAVYQPPLANPVQEVESVMNHRLIEYTRNAKKYRTNIVGVSGGVRFDAQQVISERDYTVDTDLGREARTRDPSGLGAEHWWWD